MIHGPNIPVSYAILLIAALDLTSITSHIHNLVVFLLWLCLFILFGVVSPLFSSSILGNYQPGDFIFQCPIFLPFHALHGVLKARILMWFAIPFSSGPHSVKSFHHDPPVLGCPTGNYFPEKSEYVYNSPPGYCLSFALRLTDPVSERNTTPPAFLLLGSFIA